MSTWTKYRRTNIAEMRPYVEAEDMEAVSVSAPDQHLFIVNRDQFNRGMIARNPQNHNDKWYVARDYFDANFEPISEES